MKLIIKLIRNLVGLIMSFFDVITRGPKLKRPSEVQKEVDKQAESLTLYQFFACPFCIKTRRVIYKLNVPIQTRDASEGSPHRQVLLDGGGKIQTPCLRIENQGEVEWLYESSDIIKYLRQRFS